MRPPTDFITLALIAVLAGGCASNDAAMEPVAEAEAEVDAALVEEPLDPALVAGPPVDLAAPSDTPAEPIGADTADASSDSESFWRPDGRPIWWLAEPRSEDGRVVLTVEAMGRDLSDARAKAISAAREAVRRHAGPAPGGERLEALVVRKLEGDAPGRSRYVGYARVSAREPESLSP